MSSRVQLRRRRRRASKNLRLALEHERWLRRFRHDRPRRYVLDALGSRDELDTAWRVGHHAGKLFLLREQSS